MDKKAQYYSNAEVAKHYEFRRFVRGGGGYVAKKEAACISNLLNATGLSAGGLGLDCPTGTGRFIPVLQSIGITVIAADISNSMLALAEQYGADKYLNESADALSLGDNSADIWLMSRFCFHFDDPRSFLREAFRVLKPNGYLVVDFYNWTPRALIPGKQAWLGGRTYTHTKSKVAEFAKEIGFSVVNEQPVFAIAPYLYGFVPSVAVLAIEFLSDYLPQSLKTKSYYLLQKPQ